MSRQPRPPLTVAFRALRNRNYRLFWTGQIVSQAGTWMQRVAQAWLVLRLTDSPLALGTVTTVQFLPILCFSLFGGVLADRMPKRRLLITTQSLAMLQSLLLAVLVSTGTVQLWHVYILAAMLGISNAVDQPARQSFVVEMVGQDDLPNAVALNSTQFNVARLVGPALGGLTIAWVGVAGCFYLNSVSFSAVLAGLLLMRPSELYAPRHTPSRGPVFREIGEGLRYAVTTPDIALVLLLMAVLGTFGYNFTVILPLIAKYVLHAGPEGFGLLTSAMGLGSLFAALGIAYQGKATRRTLFIGSSAFSALLFLVALSSWWVVTLPLVAVLGVASITFTATANTRLQLIAPPHLRGRIMSLYALLFAGTTPIGSLVVGTLADHGGVQMAVAVMAVICMAGVVAGLLYARRTGAGQPVNPEGAGDPARTPALAARQ